MDKKIQLTAAVLGVILTTALVAGATYAASGGYKGGMGNIEKNKGVMHEAFEAGDYTLLGENPKISQEKFNELLAKYQENDGKLFMRGEGKEGRGMGMHGEGMGMKMDKETRAAINAALTAGDYNAWLEAVGEDCPMLENIDSAEKFTRYAEAHKLMEQARVIMEELGIDRPMPMHGLK